MVKEHSRNPLGILNKPAVHIRHHSFSFWFSCILHWQARRLWNENTKLQFSSTQPVDAEKYWNTEALSTAGKKNLFQLFKLLESERNTCTGGIVGH